MRNGSSQAFSFIVHLYFQRSHTCSPMSHYCRSNEQADLIQSRLDHLLRLQFLQINSRRRRRRRRSHFSIVIVAELIRDKAWRSEEVKQNKKGCRYRYSNCPCLPRSGQLGVIRWNQKTILKHALFFRGCCRF